ncbi:MAG TPA: FkbM family methyltransferase [Burkholderiales bacterium]|nr:FkbM family methyltransferase [Burkholderiales bacterium]
MSFLWAYLTGHSMQGRPGEADPATFAFLGHCVAYLGRSRAQIFQDCYVAYRLRDKREGYFVEFGATNGVDLSNTWLLERELGWRGILAEPFPYWHAALRANRSARIDERCVWRRSGERLEFSAGETIPEYATLKSHAAGDQYAEDRRAASRTILVDTVSLTDLLAEHGAPQDIDYLSIDVEGAELDVLDGLDFARYRPRIITIEHNHQEPRRSEIQARLAPHGFVREFEAFSKFDDWYYHPDRC